jgi:hypothetical protein
VAAGAGGEWSAFGADRGARHPRALTTEQVTALVQRQGSSLSELLRIAN